MLGWVNDYDKKVGQNIFFDTKLCNLNGCLWLNISALRGLRKNHVLQPYPTQGAKQTHIQF